jgi:hypothetical protein
VAGNSSPSPRYPNPAWPFAQWKAGITEVGKSHNVVVKLGGLGMRFGMFDFYAREKPPSSMVRQKAS